MKKFICMFVVLVLCVGFAAPVYASDFVPSIPEKDIEIVPPPGEGNPIGVIRDEDGEIVEPVYGDCLVVTPISEAKTSTRIPEDARELLLEVYDKLKSGEMDLPYHKYSADLDPANMVIRDLVDISWLCEEHPKMMEEGKYVLELTFRLGVSADTTVYVMSYKNNEWDPIHKVVNNGDGTVTCQFKHLCPVAFSVEKGATPPPQTGDTADLTLWITLMAVSLVAIGAMIFVMKKSAQKNA